MRVKTDERRNNIINQLNTIIMKIGNDKIMHFMVCLVIAFAVSCLAANVLYAVWPSQAATRAIVACAAGFIVAMCFGVYKELRDMQQPGNHFCTHDLLADVAGAFAGCWGGLFTLLL